MLGLLDLDPYLFLNGLKLFIPIPFSCCIYRSSCNEATVSFFWDNSSMTRAKSCYNRLFSLSRSLSFISYSLLSLTSLMNSAKGLFLPLFSCFCFESWFSSSSMVLVFFKTRAAYPSNYPLNSFNWIVYWSIYLSFLFNISNQFGGGFY